MKVGKVDLYNINVLQSQVKPDQSAISVPELSHMTLKDQDQSSCDRCRHALDKLLNRVWFQIVVVFFVVIDFLVVIVLLLIDLNIIQAPHSSTVKDVSSSNSTQEHIELTITSVETGLHYTNIIILSFYFIELFLRVFVRGPSVIEDRWQVFDLFVVLLTFTLYLALTVSIRRRTVTYSVGLIIVFRLWRFARIYNDMVRPTEDRCQALVQHYQQLLTLCERQLQQSHTQVNSQQIEISILRDKVKKLQRTLKLGLSNYSNSTIPATSDVTDLNNQSFEDKNLTQINLADNSKNSPTGKFDQNSLQALAISAIRLHSDVVSVPDIIEDIRPDHKCAIRSTKPSQNSPKINDNTTVNITENTTVNIKENSTANKIENISACNDPCSTNSEVSELKCDSERTYHSISDTVLSQKEAAQAYDNLAFTEASHDKPDHSAEPSIDNSNTKSGLKEQSLTNHSVSLDGLGSTTYLNQEGVPITDL